MTRVFKAVAAAFLCLMMFGGALVDAPDASAGCTATTTVNLGTSEQHYDSSSGAPFYTVKKKRTTIDWCAGTVSTDTYDQFFSGMIPEQ